MQETRVRSLGQEDALQKEIANCPCILAWRILWTEEPCGLQSVGFAESQAQLSDSLWCGGGGLGTKSCPTLVTPWSVARQAPLSMGFSRQKHWSGLPCAPPGNPPDAGVEPVSFMSLALAGRFFTTRATWEAKTSDY